MITIIIGLPGSGKSELAKTLPGILYDDPKTPEELEAIKLWHSQGFDIVITDPHLCLPEVEKRARLHFPDATYIYFQNDPVQCIINARGREGKEVEQFIKLLTQYYNPPSDALPVYRKED